MDDLLHNIASCSTMEAFKCCTTSHNGAIRNVKARFHVQFWTFRLSFWCMQYTSDMFVEVDRPGYCSLEKDCHFHESQRKSLPPTVFLKTTLTWTINFHKHVTILPGSHSLML